MTQILAGAGTTVLTTVFDTTGTPGDVGDVTIGIVDGNGEEVVASGTATVKSGSGANTLYSYTLARQAAPNLLTVTWTDVDTSDIRVDRVEVVGRWLFTEAQARTFNAKADATAALIPLNSATEYPDAVLYAERERLTDDIEEWTGHGWMPRYARIQISGSGTSVLDTAEGRCRLSDGYAFYRPGRVADISTILSATAGDTAITGVVADGQRLILESGSWPRGLLNITVEYVYGYPTPTDGVDRIALMELVDRLVPSAWPDRVISADTEFGTTRFVQPGGPMKNVSRLPRVNDWVARHDDSGYWV